MDDQLIIILSALIVVLFIVFALVSFYRNKKWVESLTQFSQTKNYTYINQRDDTLRDSYQDSGYDLFQRGRSRKLENRISGQHRLTAFEMFEYRYTTGSGRSSHTYIQTVVSLGVVESNLPAFILRPRGLLDKLAKKLGKQDIGFDYYPDFSKMYHITGDDETAIRSLFNSSLIDFFQNNTSVKERSRWYVESNGNRVVIYRRGKRCKNLDELQAFLAQTFQFSDMLNRPHIVF
jgi:hypothetical protein